MYSVAECSSSTWVIIKPSLSSCLDANMIEKLNSLENLCRLFAHNGQLDVSCGLWANSCGWVRRDVPRSKGYGTVIIWRLLMWPWHANLGGGLSF